MRPRLILGFAVLLAFAATAFGQSLPPGPQVVQVPALMLPPTPPVAGGMIVPQLHKAPKGIPGFYDPATGRFTPAVSSATKASTSPSTLTETLTDYVFDMSWQFNSALKPWNTVNCTITMSITPGLSVGVIILPLPFLAYNNEEYSSFSVGNPPPQFVLIGPIQHVGEPIQNVSEQLTRTVSCNAEDDSGVIHSDTDTNLYPSLFPDNPVEWVPLRL
jgi:hypothetical protein